MRVGVGGLLLSACLFFCGLKSQIRSPDAILPDYVICNNIKFTLITLLPARSGGSIGGESEAPGSKCVRRLKLVTVSRVRHSPVSLYRVHVLKKGHLFVFIIDEK